MASASRRRTVAIAAITLAALLFGASPPPSPQDLANGIWAGSMALGKNSTYFTVAFPHAAAADDPAGDLYFPKKSEVGLPLAGVTNARGTISFAASRTLHTYEFSGTLSGGEMRGTARDGESEGAFVVRHLVRLAPALLEPLVGNYRAADREIMIARPYTYIMFLDSKTGRMGFLWPFGDDSFFGGPSKGIYYPVAMTFRFELQRSGNVGALVVDYGAERPIRAVRMPSFASKPLSFRSGGALISGTMYFPHREPPYPAVMLLAGSNYQTRSAQNAFLSWVGDVFLRRGFAVYAYDKRGAGFSTGERDDGFVVADAIRGFGTMSRQPGLDSKCLGIWGVSQGGMAAPKVAASVSDVSFIVNTSGAVVNANLQEIQRTAMEMRADGFSESDVRDAVRLQTLKFDYAMTGRGWTNYAAALEAYKDRAWFPDPYVGPPTDPKSPAFAFWRKGGADAPADYWKRFHGRVLYIDGQYETNQDPKANFGAFEVAMKVADNHSYSTIIVRGADHSMLIDHHGGNKIDRLITTYAMTYFADLGRWIDTLHCA
jgi:pimeloyl-ACP methyl ester carboxylesterase